MHSGNPYDVPDARQIIRTLRIQRGYASDRALALAAGINQPTLSRYLAGDSKTMELANFQALADTLEVTLSELLGEVPLSSGTRVREIQRIMAKLPEAMQQALVAAGEAMLNAQGGPPPTPK